MTIATYISDSDTLYLWLLKHTNVGTVMFVGIKLPGLVCICKHS